MFSERIKELRQNENISQAKLAKIVGVNPASISFYETNKNAPSEPVKIALAKYFNVSVDYLMGITDNKEKYPDENDLEIQEKDADDKKVILKNKKSNEINDTMLEKLKKNNVSTNEEKTKERVQEIWQNADNKSKRALSAFIGYSFGETAKRIGKSGSITPRIVITMARHLDVNPLYIIGEVDERGNFNDDLLKKFLIKLGYKKLWNEYAKFLKNVKIENDVNDQNEVVEIVETPTETVEMSDEDKDAYIRETLKELDKSDKKHGNLDTPINIISVDESADISSETLDYINTLSEDSIIALLRATLIRANAPNANIKHKQLANQIIYKMLSD